MRPAGGGALDRRGARPHQRGGQRVHHDDVAHAGGRQQAAQVHGAAGDGQADGVGDLARRARAGGREDLRRRRAAPRRSARRPARDRTDHPPDRQGPGVAEPQDARATRCWAGPGRPAAARRPATGRSQRPPTALASDGEQADRHEDEATPALTSWRHPNSRPPGRSRRQRCRGRRRPRRRARPGRARPSPTA